VQHRLAWHTEQFYEFTMKTRTNKSMFDGFTNKFQDYHLENDENINQEVKWFIDFVTEIKYVSFLTLQPHLSCLLLQKPSGYGQ